VESSFELSVAAKFDEDDFIKEEAHEVEGLVYGGLVGEWVGVGHLVDVGGAVLGCDWRMRLIRAVVLTNPVTVGVCYMHWRGVQAESELCRDF